MFSNVDISHLCLSVGLLILTSVIGKIQAGPVQFTDPDEVLGQPCKTYRREISFPIVNDASGEVRLNDVKASLEPRDLLHVRMKWRRQKFELLLFKNEVTVPLTVSEWYDGNVTFQRLLRRKCFYQGYIKGQRSSYAALSTCDGLSGYIQTDTELLFIEPRSHNSDATQRQPHLVYTCEEAQRDTASNMRNPVSTAKHQRRVRRAARSPKYLEVKLVVDYSLWHTIGSKERTEIYVMTLMNFANTVFQHKTLDVDIRIVVTKLIFLNQTLSSFVNTKLMDLPYILFCPWSEAQIPDGQEVDYDLALFLTNVPLGPGILGIGFRTEWVVLNACDDSDILDSQCQSTFFLIGKDSRYAYFQSVCEKHSCAVVAIQGYIAGEIIAHEAAHAFGLSHDGEDGNLCSGWKYIDSVMAPSQGTKFNHFWWSECSSKQMKEVIKNLDCLNNKPEIPKGHFDLEAQQSIQELGKSWSLDFQCLLHHGQDYSYCTSLDKDPCGVLWCEREQFSCVTESNMVKPGTSCGQQRECRDGRCVYSGNGNWGAWSSWSDCSTDCGLGVKKKERVCDNPEPEFDGQPCEGESSTSDICSDHTCENNYPYGRREAWCALWNDPSLPGENNWIPFEAQNASLLCKLTCKSLPKDELRILNINIFNDTPCSYTGNNSNICIGGECRIAGCDGKLNSTKKHDMCGICDGDGSQCKIVSGTMTKSVNSSTQYVRILTLPRGARNIKIEKTSKDTTPFLAIKDIDLGIYVLNGGKIQSKTISLAIVGPMFYYNRQNRTHEEAITSPGPLLRTVEIQFYPNRKTDPVTVDYSYTVHKSDFTLEKSQYMWRFDRWSECSVTCGQGVQTILRKCSYIDTEEKVDDELCRFLDKPVDEPSVCDRGPCVYYRWQATEAWSECDAACDQDGIQRRELQCQKVRKIRGVDDVTNVTDSMCDDLPSPTPETRPCKGELCPLKWKVGNWSKCTVTCGMGKMYRFVYCGDKDTYRDGIGCKDDELPRTSKICNNKPCPMTDDANCTDKYSFCKVYRALVFRCTRSTFRKVCCKTCKATLENQGANTRPQNALERYMMRKGLGKWSRTR